jgi:hypothetical protein
MAMGQSAVLLLLLLLWWVLGRSQHGATIMSNVTATDGGVSKMAHLSTD